MVSISRLKGETWEDMAVRFGKKKGKAEVVRQSFRRAVSEGHSGLKAVMFALYDCKTVTPQDEQDDDNCNG